MPLDNQCYRYTPDAGTVDGPCSCGVCGETMTVERGCFGPRSYSSAMLFHSTDGQQGGSAYDLFLCPYADADWHKQAVAIRREAGHTNSTRLQGILLKDAEDIISSRQATKKVYL